MVETVGPCVKALAVCFNEGSISHTFRGLSSAGMEESPDNSFARGSLCPCTENQWRVLTMYHIAPRQRGNHFQSYTWLYTSQ